MFKYLVSYGLILAFQCNILLANQDVDSLRFSAIRNLWEVANPRNQFGLSIAKDNPAMYTNFSTLSVSEFELIGRTYKEQQAIDWQKGSRYNNFQIKATSQIRLNAHSFVWGGASYLNNKTKEIQFNDNSDLSLIYPYIMLDSVGGEMKNEEYCFNGGYLHEFNSNLNIAVELDYRAQSAYRQFDPRPKNTVSDLLFKVGIASSFNTKYLWGASTDVRKYKQDSNIAFFSEKKRVPIYHYTGLGNRYARFDGTFLSSQHDGYGYGIHLTVNEKNNNGFISEFSYKYFQFKKLMTSLNDIPLNKLTENHFKYNFGYQSKQWAISILGILNKRKGYEYIYGTPQGGVYKHINITTPYSHKQQLLGIRSLFIIGRNNLQWFIEPSVSHIKEDENYTDPNSFINVQNIQPTLSTTLRINTNKGGMFTLKQYFQYNYNIKFSSYIDTEIIENNPLLPLTNHMLSYLGKNKMAGRASVRWDLPFQISSINWFTEIAWETTHISGFKPIQYGEVKVGLIF